MRDRPTEAIAARQTRGAALAEAVERVVAANVSAGQMMTAAAVARQAGCSRDFLYRHGFAGPDGTIATANRQIAGDRAADVDLSHRGAIHTLEVDLTNTRADNQTLRRYVHALEQRLGEQLGSRDMTGPDPTQRIEQLVDENDRLRHRLVELEDETDELRHRLRTALRDTNISTVTHVASSVADPP